MEWFTDIINGPQLKSFYDTFIVFTAVKNKIGIFFVNLLLFNASHTSYPFITGIIMSNNIISGNFDLAIDIPFKGIAGR